MLVSSLALCSALAVGPATVTATGINVTVTNSSTQALQVDRARYVANSAPRANGLFAVTRLEGKAQTEYLVATGIEGNSSAVLTLPDVFDCVEHGYSVYVVLEACSPWAGPPG